MKSVARVRAALDREHPRTALRHLWTGVSIAVYNEDEQALEALLEVAIDFGRRSKGRTQAQTAIAQRYCARCLADVRAGIKPRNLGEFFGRAPRLISCPDCAMKVPATARVCHYCGYRFDGSNAPDA
jgi:hypothetical protein